MSGPGESPAKRARTGAAGAPEAGGGDAAALPRDASAQGDAGGEAPEERPPLAAWRVFCGSARQTAKDLETGSGTSSTGQACLVASSDGSVLFFGVAFNKEYRNAAPEWSVAGRLTPDPASSSPPPAAGPLKFTWGAGCVAQLKVTGDSAVLTVGDSSRRCGRGIYSVKVQCKLDLVQDLVEDPNSAARTEAAALERSLRQFVREGVAEVAEAGEKGRCARLLHNLRGKVSGVADSLAQLDSGSSASRRVCVIGATGTGKSSLVNALLGQKVAPSAGSGRAVTSVPTEYHFSESVPAPSTSGSEDGRRRLDVVSGTLESMRLYFSNLPRARFVGTLQFLKAAEMKKLLEGCVDDLTSPIVTSSEKTRECLPVLRLLFPKEAWEPLLEKMKIFEIGPDTPEERCCELREALFNHLSEQLARHAGGARPTLGGSGAGAPTMQSLNSEHPPACMLQGARVEASLFSLQTFRELESRYWRVLDHVEIGSPKFRLLEVPEAGGDVRLVDVPGFGDECGLREKIAERYLNLADKVLVCAACARAGSDRQTKEYLRKDALQELQMKRAGRDSIVFCATKSDQASIEELQENDPFEEDSSVLRTMHTEQVRENVKAMLEDFKYGKNMKVAVLSAERYWELGARGASRVSKDGFSLASTEVPGLSQLVFRSLWADASSARTSALKEIQQQCKDGLEDTQARLAAARNNEREADVGATAEEITEVVRQAVHMAGEELKKSVSSSGGLADAIQNMLDELKKVDDGVQAAAKSCDRAAHAVASDWNSLHWGTYRATLSKHGEHEGVKGKQDFNADLFRNFRDSLQDRGWSEFFERYREHLQEFKQVIVSGWAGFVEKIVAKIAAAKTLPEKERKEVAREVEQKAQATGGGTSITLDIHVNMVVQAARQLQDQLESPKDKVKIELGPRFSHIATSESGTGSHARRKARVGSLLAPGCGMASKTGELTQGCAEIRVKALKLPEEAAKALQDKAKDLSRGSWSVDFSCCPICHAEECEDGAERPWSVFPCFHGGHADCISEYVRSRPAPARPECPVCRTACAAGDVQQAAQRDPPDPIAALERTEALLAGALGAVARLLDRRGRLGEEEQEPAASAGPAGDDDAGAGCGGAAESD